MACDEAVIAIDEAEMGDNTHVTPAEDDSVPKIWSPASAVSTYEVPQPSDGRVVDTTTGEPPGYSTTASSAVSSTTKGCRRFTLAEQIAKERKAEDLALSEKSSPQSEIVDNTIVEPPRPISVILFGRTGSGKSTLAQMLTMGRLDPDSEDFAYSSGIRGETKELQHGEGRGWRVVDTPGFGEPRDKHSTISSEEAEKKIRRYIQMIEGTYTHFLYTVMRDRIDELDKKLWKFFVRVFGDGIKKNFSVVISNASVGWVENNREDLAACFKDCDSFLNAEFPSTRGDDAEWEMELAEIRTASLEELEKQLAKLGRDAVMCEVDGGLLTMTSRHLSASKASLKRIVMSVADRASSGISGVVRSILQISGLMEDGVVVLMPEIGLSCVQSKGISNHS